MIQYPQPPVTFDPSEMREYIQMGRARVRELLEESRRLEERIAAYELLLRIHFPDDAPPQPAKPDAHASTNALSKWMATLGRPAESGARVTLADRAVMLLRHHPSGLVIRELGSRLGLSTDSQLASLTTLLRRDPRIERHHTAGGFVYRLDPIATPASYFLAT